jgi:hypothetical protein
MRAAKQKQLASLRHLFCYGRIGDPEADSRYKSERGERSVICHQTNPMYGKKSIAICKFVIGKTLSLTPRAGSRWGRCAAREARQEVWQRAR